MWLQRFQKLTSFALIFFLLFSFTLRIPIEIFMTPSTYADDEEFYNLVSIIVDEESYDEVKSKLVRYSRDIQKVLEDTRVVILPTPSDASVLDIASLNESLFFEGYKGVKDVDFESRLVGTILVGKIPVPLVFENGESAKSIIPYVDFEEKSYIYDHESKKYEKSDQSDTNLVPEIWHGVISPNTGNDPENIQAIKDYFDKNHDFYTGKGVFDQSKGVIDGKDASAGSTYEPHVFYYDQFKENKAIQYQKYMGYKMYLQNVEDITYNRYSKELAKKVKDQVLGVENNDIKDLIVKVDPDFDMSAFDHGGIDESNSPDVITRYITDNATKKYLEIFNASALGDMRKHVYNAGRYNESGSKVNMDIPPFLISTLDQVSAEVIKNVNNSLERKITDIVANGLSRKIAIPVQMETTTPGGGGTACKGVYSTFYYGRSASSMTSAAECSIYKGSTDSGTLVEANRGYNVKNLGENSPSGMGDIGLCARALEVDASTGKLTKGVSGFWAGNTPINLGAGVNGDVNFQLGTHQLKNGIRPVFDIVGSKEITNTALIPSPLNCFNDGQSIKTYHEFEHSYTTGSGDDEDTHYICRLGYSLAVNPGDATEYYTRYGSESSVKGLPTSPVGTTSISRFCAATNVIGTPISAFDSVYKNGFTVGLCETKRGYLSGVEFMSAVGSGVGQVTEGGSDDSSQPVCPSEPIQDITFNGITSHVLHTSPTPAEFGAQTKSLFTPSLPIDKNRYIDFIGANGQGADYGYQKIDFPQLFRVVTDPGDDITLESIEKKVQAHLNNVSDQINAVKGNSDPSTLSGKDKEIYDILSTGAFPSADVDLYQYLQDKPLEVFSIDNQSKEISYYDTLVFAVYWNNLTTISSKYKFIFQEYLSNEFEGNDFQFHLPKSKKSYETAYFAAPGDAQNMYIKLDPEMKGTHPYASILGANLQLQTILRTSNVATPDEDKEGEFKCSPPDGVPIWQWVPAIICWIMDMLPPTIKISPGSCGYDTLFLDDEEKEALAACQGDVNKNGINDCIEGKLSGGSLDISSDAGRYYYHTSGVLDVEIRDKDKHVVSFDSISYVDHFLSKVEVPEDSTQTFTSVNSRVIYDINVEKLSTPEALKEAQKYVRYRSVKIRANQGRTKTYFYGKGQDANVYFEARLEAQDDKGNTVIDLKSNTKKIEIRGDRVFINSYSIDSDGASSSNNTIIVSSHQNIFLTDGAEINKDEAAGKIQALSVAEEKILLMVTNYSVAGNALPLNYPLTVALYQEGEQVYLQKDITKTMISNPFPLFAAQKSGRYEIRLEDASGYQSTRNLDILPDVATSLTTNISTTLVETGKNLSTHLLTITDQYGNPATGEIYNVELSLNGGGLVFDTNKEDTITYQIVEGYKAFRLKSTDVSANNTLKIVLKDISGTTISETTNTIRSIDDIKIVVDELDATPKVGGGTYKYKLSFVDSSGTILTDLNSRAYMSIPRIYGKVPQAYTKVIDGVTTVELITGTLAARDIALEFQLEGGNEIYKYAVDILPEEAIKIDLQLGRDKIEASRDDTTPLEAILKDRYNNEVFTDSSTSISVDVHESSASIITIDSTQKTVINGKARFKISGTDIPGIGYFKVSSTPDLGNNSFDMVGQAPFEKVKLTIPTMKDKDGNLTSVGKKFYKEFIKTKIISKFITLSRLERSTAYKELPSVLQKQVSDFWGETNKLTVSGIGENAGSVETFFFWDKDDISGNAYNGIYSVLGGAPYGDITKKDYLGGALLFDRDNSSLAVSTLLNTPYKYHDVFSLEKDGLLKALGKGDVTQDIQFEAGFDGEDRLIVDINNDALKTYIGRIYYNISEDSDITVKLKDNIGYSLDIEGEDVFIQDAVGKRIFEIYESGRFKRKSGSSISIDSTYRASGIKLLIHHGGDAIGHILIEGDFGVNITRDTTVLKNKLSSLKNTIIVHLSSNQYSSRIITSDTDTSGINFYYKDPFTDKYALNDFHNTDLIGLESSSKESGIGWKDSNTMLLSFSAGESVGDATKHFQSFSLINLGDPVASLKPLEKTFKTGEKKSFDSTIGEMIEGKDNLLDFRVFDYNNDGKTDILTLQQDGYLQLFENAKVEGGFIKHGSLVYADDGGAIRLVKTGDFTGDGYDDIFFVTEKGKPALFNNVKKDFIRHDLDEVMSLSGTIIQVESYDMDADGKDDIVTLDSAGEIHIFYGSGESETPNFTKEFIGDGYAIELSDAIINHGGAVYFDGLVQIDPDKAAGILLNSQKYIQEVKLKNEAKQEISIPKNVDEGLVDSFLYVQLPYIPTEHDDPRSQKEILLDGLDASLSGVGGSVEGENLSEISDQIEDFTSEYESYISYSGYKSAYNTQVYFLRSEYADTQGLKITKKYTDTTPTKLQTADRVHMDITLKNTSSKLINNVAYVDSIPEYFKFASEEIIILGEDGGKLERKLGVGTYNILIDGFFLEPGEEVTLRIELETLPLQYGHMQVGLYEKGEVGDDEWGDIILKKDEENCGQEADIYRSTDVRAYQEGKTVPECKLSDIEIGNQFPKLIDSDEDGIPDYLQNLLITDSDGNLVPTSDTDAITKYSDEIFDELGIDSDGDGIPDKDDTMANTAEGGDFMDALDAINGMVDEISEQIDEIVEGLSCGFGGGSCFASPLNWAPLAPGNDLTLYGKPIGDGLKVDEGIPIFSALTGLNVPVPFGCIQVPVFWPMTPVSYTGACNATKGAGGTMGVDSPSNFVRIFATPTLTGAGGIAVCFGGPARAAGNANPMGVHPIVPGGNCIVAAMPLFGCEGGEGDPGVMGYPYPGNGFGVIHANCDGVANNLVTPMEVENAFVKDYLEYQKTGIKPAGLFEKYEQAFEKVSEDGGANFTLPSGPLLTIGDGDPTLSVALDTSALASGDFKDVVQINNKRTGAFPSFIMDWVERQLDEVTSKLTNLPKLFIILPDFEGIFDYSWDDFGSGMEEAFEKGKTEEENKKGKIDSKVSALRVSKSGLECLGKDRVECKKIDLQISSAESKRFEGSGKETMSGIKEVYEFIGNIPLVDVETETININVPWIDMAELNRFSLDWEYSLEQWTGEVEAAKKIWEKEKECTGTGADKERCEEQNEINIDAAIQADKFLNSLERNIQTLEEYKEFPEKLSKLINIKEVWLEQILCNIEAISELVGGWLGENGERFKAWVELYILIKAALKSWQLLIDVFADYEEECHECKNERQDLEGFVFELVSMVIPSLPIIEFPKWPDIILDLHNIRAGITIYMPDFQMNMRPIILPDLPDLKLPAIPDVNFNLPELPLLPRFEIPELPDLPSLPTIELPDLPPPPKIPKLFGAVEGILNIMKLITKVMCILKSSPFVPEWRAGDQIAFITERNGYLPTDFIDIKMPAFSYSAISAIKVTTYVNLEFEMEFIVEAVRTITAPLNDITNNIVNMFNNTLSDMSISEVDLSDLAPESIDVDIELDGEVNVDISLAPLDENPEGILFIVAMLAQKSEELFEYILAHNTDTLSNSEFKRYVGEQLASESMISNHRTQELRSLWNEVGQLTYSKEEAFIQELQDNRKKKFQIVQDIISTEIEYGKQQIKELQNLGAPSYIIQTAQETSGTERIGAYNTLLETYNIKTLDAAINLASGESEEARKSREDIQEEGENFMGRIKGGLTAYKENALLAAEGGTGSGSGGACKPNGTYEYVYEGIYVLEHDKNYRLFDYVDMLRGDEEPTIIDIDNDGDDDILYKVKGKIYFKENKTIQAPESHVTIGPLVLRASDNKFYNGSTYYESVNYFEEASVSDESINIEFDKPTDTELRNFRMKYYTIVDRYIDQGDNFIPRNIQTHIVDAIADIESQSALTETDEYRVSPHLATLTSAGAMAGIKLTTEKLNNIKSELAGNTQVTITSGAKIYAGENEFKIEYISGTSEIEELIVPAYHTVVFEDLVNITALSGNAYVSAGISIDIVGADLVDYIGMPLLEGDKIRYLGDTSVLNESSHVDIRYYDGSVLQMDFRDITSYRLYDLGDKNRDTHTIRLRIKNDFYYARIQTFKENILGTQSQQILLSPQKYSDNLPPQIVLTQKIRIPVYQSQVVDLTPYIYEDGGLAGISEVRIDFDLGVDSDGDGNSENDADTDNIEITKTPSRIAIKFGPYDTLFKKQINISLVDDNGNIGSRKVKFEVYPPQPAIQSIEENIISGQIDETLLDEPVRLYRYRGGVVKKLQADDGTDVIDTNATGDYSFHASKTGSGVSLSYSGSQIAFIDEYTGRIDIDSVLVGIDVFASNDVRNTSIYPEIQISHAEESIFKQHIQIPEAEIQVVSQLQNLEEVAIHMALINQDQYSTYKIPHTVPYNPGSVVVYLTSDEDKKAVMTLFRDGRIHINQTLYKLEYRTIGENSSLVLVQKGTSIDIAQVVYNMDASYIIR